MDSLPLNKIIRDAEDLYDPSKDELNFLIERSQRFGSEIVYQKEDFDFKEWVRQIYCELMKNEHARIIMIFVSRATKVVIIYKPKHHIISDIKTNGFIGNIIDDASCARVEQIIIDTWDYENGENRDVLKAEIIHKFCLFAVHETLHNRYGAFNLDNEHKTVFRNNKWNVALQECAEKGRFENFIARIFDCYLEEKSLQKLVVRYFQYLVKFQNDEQKLSELKQNFPKLCKIFENFVLENFKVEHEKNHSINRKMNEGETLIKAVSPNETDACSYDLTCDPSYDTQSVKSNKTALISKSPSNINVNLKKISSKEFIDFLILGSVTVIFASLNYASFFGSGSFGGFFCDDESLMHPFQESRVTHVTLYSVGFLNPLLTIVITELIERKLNTDNGGSVRIYGLDIPYCVRHISKIYGIFLFGASWNHFATDMAKHMISRYRPHFFSVCQPMIQPGNSTCNDPFNRYRQIHDFICGNHELSPRRLNELQLSFPCGHSSFSTYTMVFAALYLHCRTKWFGSKLLKHVWQFSSIMFAWFIALSRVAEHQNHWSDVLAGSALGLFICLLTVLSVSDIFKDNGKPKKSKSKT